MAETPAQEAAAGVADDFFSEVEPFTEEGQAEPANEATEEVEQSQEEGLPEFSWDTPEELKDILEAPDFEEDEDDDEPEFEPAAQQGDEDGFETPEMARLRKQNAKLQKKLAWAEEQKAKANIKGWREEGRKYFQFANVDEIEAKSRRAFLKEAQRQHQAVSNVVKPVYEQLAAEKARLKEQALAEARAEAEQRWGAPSSGPTTASNYLEDTQTNKRERLANGAKLVDLIKNRHLDKL